MEDGRRESSPNPSLSSSLSRLPSAGNCFLDFPYNPPAMANVEHVALLLSSDWNSWRLRNANVTPDLTSADLSGKDLTDKDLKRADLTRANLSGTTLSGTDFTRATLEDARFS